MNECGKLMRTRLMMSIKQWEEDKNVKYWETWNVSQDTPRNSVIASASCFFNAVTDFQS